MIDYDVLAIQFLYCSELVVIFFTFALLCAVGLTFKNKPITARNRLVIVVSKTFLIVQLPIVLYRLILSLDPYFILTGDVLAVNINYFLSPICTLLIIWLFITHLIDSCAGCETIIPRKNINAKIKKLFAFYLISGGIIIGLLIDEIVLNLLNVSPESVVIAACVTIPTIAIIEILILRAKNNLIGLLSRTWMASIGIWLYFLLKAAYDFGSILHKISYNN